MNTNGHDAWIRAALAPARRLEPTSGEVAAALATAARTAPPRPLGRRANPAPLARRTVALAAVAALLLATAAAAATGLLPVGSVFEGEGFHADSQRVAETVVATGEVPKSGRWRMTAFETEKGVACLKLTLLQASKAGPRSSGHCGARLSFEPFSLGRRAAAEARGEVVLFGRAPANASAVHLTGSGKASITVPTHAGPDSEPGRYWVLAAPPGLDKATVSWLDAQGHPRGFADTSFFFAGPGAPTVVATGAAPLAGPWRLTAYESERSVVDGDLYQPEGLPCVTLWLREPRRDAASASGGCGVLRKAPGFTKHGLTLPAVVGKPAEEHLLFGNAPERADAVELSGPRGTVATDTVAGPAIAGQGRFWVLAATPEQYGGGRVYWVDRDTGTRGPAFEP